MSEPSSSVSTSHVISCFFSITIEYIQTWNASLSLLTATIQFGLDFISLLAVMLFVHLPRAASIRK
jgi:hypothetical protein